MEHSKKEMPADPPSYEETMRMDQHRQHYAEDHNDYRPEEPRYRHVHVPIRTARTNYPAGGSYTYSSSST
ncbi:uncharacterized protein GVI51_K06215 [Nakaseomyces glabratus]|uniref:Uncharacterized protein n=1 Tax=Candida glabrata TaxID=5478 RepID=A7X7K0_CANGB|nr:hypothetical protein [Nakaseomyces glabratus]KAH7582273.1 hypothetical protein J7296_03607 [Nakaseomyces glabratus]KAH7583181.1 hypothetical protein J7298_03804 [Nakaseomyces glabratus]KAH7584604.1 hypothetical protein J7297_03807 [Nakaseomyces glabratus]KAH7596205.1 hypothetical protein J7295_03774 [Nakaseomyces glabratus]